MSARGPQAFPVNFSGASHIAGRAHRHSAGGDKTKKKEKKRESQRSCTLEKLAPMGDPFRISRLSIRAHRHRVRTAGGRHQLQTPATASSDGPDITRLISGSRSKIRSKPRAPYSEGPTLFR